MNIIVLDQATKSMGITIVSVENNRCEWLMCENLLIKGDTIDRMKQAYDRISDLISEYNANTLVLEDVPPMMVNFKTTATLLKLEGVLELLAKQKSIKCVKMNIRKWKSLAGITSKGRDAQKKESILLACGRWNRFIPIIGKCDDVADALNISYAYIKSIGVSVD